MANTPSKTKGRTSTRRTTATEKGSSYAKGRVKKSTKATKTNFEEDPLTDDDTNNVHEEESDEEKIRVTQPDEVDDDDEEDDDGEDASGKSDDSDSEEEGDVPEAPLPKRRKTAKALSKTEQRRHTQQAERIIAQLNRVKRGDDDEGVPLENSFVQQQKNVAMLSATPTGVLRVYHSGTFHIAEPEDEEDDEYHMKFLGHVGGLKPGTTATPVNIEHENFSETASFTGVTEDIVKNHYAVPENRKALIAVDKVKKANKRKYTDVLLLQFVPSDFLSWLGDKTRTAFELYSHVLLFISNIDDPSLRQECREACEPLLEWCLCSCMKTKKDSPLTTPAHSITTVVDPSPVCAERLQERLMATGLLTRKSSGHNGQSVTEAATAAAEAVTATLLPSLLNATGGAKSSTKAEKESGKWSDFQKKQIMNFCNVDDWDDVSEFWDEIEGVKDPVEVESKIRKHMKIAAEELSASLGTFHISINRVKDMMKLLLSPGPGATLSNLKDGIVILDFVPRSKQEAADLKNWEKEERESEHNRTLSESTTISDRRDKSIGTVPSDIPKAQRTTTVYVCFLRGVFGTRCHHFIMARKAKRIADNWDEMDGEKIRNFFWAIINDARQFFAAHNESEDGTPKSNLDFHLTNYENDVYLPMSTLPRTWRNATSPPTIAGGGRDKGGGYLSKANEEKTRGGERMEWKNNDMHPHIEAEMKQFNAHFEKLVLNRIVQAAGREMKELSKFRAGKKETCLLFVAGECPSAKFQGRCKRHHPKRREISDDDATLFCEVIKPGIKSMIANKEKHSDLGLK